MSAYASPLLSLSLPCEPCVALAVCEAAATHPSALRPVYDETVRAVLVILDLGHLPVAERHLERDRVQRWLDHCAREREAIAWAPWLAAKGMGL